MASIALGSISNFRSAIIDEAPQSIRYRLSIASSKKQALFRPPLPKASPDPKNLTRMAIALVKSRSSCRPRLLPAFDDIVVGQHVHTLE
jgi:hypothetical protein